MTDKETRLRVGQVPVPSFPSVACAAAPSLKEARIALLTTAALFPRGQSDWRRGDESFRVLRTEQDNVMLGHQSANFDQSGFAQDLNTVFPIQRLLEMAEREEIGSVAPRHLSFLGTQNETMDTIRYDSGPLAAELLRKDGVDVVLTLPVCPLCTRTSGTLAHVLEAHGIATVSISLVRGISERLRPPRTLFCEFPFGRPLGKPGDAEFQSCVLRSALALTSRTDVPVLENFEEPVHSDEGGTFTCQIPPSLDESEQEPAVREAKAYLNAYRRSAARRGRSLVGRAIEPDRVPSAVNAFIEYLSDRSLSHFDGLGHPTSLAMDIRAYYEEAAMELSEMPLGARATDRWFFSSTDSGRLLVEVRKAMASAGVAKEVWHGLAARGE